MKMKKTAAMVLAAVIAASVPLAGSENSALSVTAKAWVDMGNIEVFEEGDWGYIVNSDNTASIRKYKGEDTVVVIPSELGGMPVTAIYQYVDMGVCKKVTIPASIISMSAHSLTKTSMGSQVEEIVVDSANPVYSSADGVLFNKDKSVLLDCPLGKSGTYVIPDSVTKIADYAFERCRSITGITIPNSVTSIGDYAFANCRLTTITIPDSVTSIGEAAFIFDSYDKSLEEINVDINNTKYSSLNGVLFDKEKTELICYPCNKDDLTYDIPERVTVIGEYAFFNCDTITEVTFPSGLKEIGNYAFKSCEALKGSIVIPSNVTSIGGLAFYGTAIESVLIPSGVEWIQIQTFFGCTSLKSITIPNSVTLIDLDAFEVCPSLETVNFIGTGEEWEAIDIRSGNEYLKNATITFSDSTTSQPTTPSRPTPSYPTISQPVTSEPTKSDTTEPTVFEPVIDKAESLDGATKEVLGGITVTDSNGAFEDGVVMNVSFIESTDGQFSFDITFTKNGREVQPDGKVTVKLPVPEALKNGNIYVYHYDDNSSTTLIPLPSKVENGFVVFETDKFSVYTLSNELIEDEAPDTSSDVNSETSPADSSSAPVSSETTNLGSNPNTGIGYAFVPVLIAAGAVIATTRKRK